MRIREQLRRYRFLLAAIAGVIVIAAWDRALGQRAASVFLFSFREMILVIPPIFVLLGLLDVWVPREMMVKYMGEGSGLKGIILALFLGSAAAGPLYGAFPVAAVFMKKGARFFNILIFLGAWSTTKLPMFLFEMSALGARFALTRLLVDIPGIIIIAKLLSLFVSQDEIQRIYKNSVMM